MGVMHLRRAGTPLRRQSAKSAKALTRALQYLSGLSLSRYAMNFSRVRRRKVAGKKREDHVRVILDCLGSEISAYCRTTGWHTSARCSAKYESSWRAAADNSSSSASHSASAERP